MDKIRFESFKASLLALAPLHAQVSEAAKKVPKFWLTSMLHSGDVAVHVPKVDHEALGYLVDVTVVHKEDIRDFDITFTFSENPFFSNTTLTKSFTVTPPAGEGEVPAAHDLTADVYLKPSEPILWKSADKDLTKIAPKIDTDGDEDMGDFEFDDEKGLFGSFFGLFNRTGEDEDSLGEHLVEWRANAIEFFVEADTDSDDEWDDEEEEHSHGPNCKH